MKPPSPLPARVRILDFAVLGLVFAFVLEAVLKVHGATHIAAVLFAGVLIGVVVRTLLVPVAGLVRSAEFAQAVFNTSIGLGAVALIVGAIVQFGGNPGLSVFGQRSVLAGAWLFAAGLIGVGLMLLWRLRKRNSRQ